MSRLLTRFPSCADAARWTTVLMVASLGACTAVGPEFRAPAQKEVPASFAERHSGSALLKAPESAESSPLPADRWSVFGDPTLLALQDHARRNNGDLATAAMRLAESRVQRSIVGSQRAPVVEATAAVSRQRQSETGAATRFLSAVPVDQDKLLALIGEPFTLYRAGVDASWELDLWGRVRRSIEAADADSAGAGATLHDVRAGIVADVARQYLALRAVQQQIALLAEQSALSADLQRLLAGQWRAGLVDESASVRQRIVGEDLAARLPPLLEQEASDMRRIEWLCGEMPGALSAQLTERTETIATPAASSDSPTLAHDWPDLSVGVPSTLAERRPDIEAAAARLHAATAQIGVATADLYPRISIGASLGSESVGALRLGDWASGVWSIGPSLVLPLFDGGRRRAVVDLREIQQQQAAVAYQQTVLKAWHEVDAAIGAYMAERIRYERLRARLLAAEDAQELARLRFERGLTDDVPALDAHRVRLDAERDRAESHGRLGLALVAVYQALGSADGQQ